MSDNNLFPVRDDATAIIREGGDPNDSRIITCREPHAEVCEPANAPNSRGIEEGDRRRRKPSGISGAGDLPTQPLSE